MSSRINCIVCQNAGSTGDLVGSMYVWQATG